MNVFNAFSPFIVCIVEPILLQPFLYFFFGAFHINFLLEHHYLFLFNYAYLCHGLPAIGVGQLRCSLFIKTQGAEQDRIEKNHFFAKFSTSDFYTNFHPNLK
ncbi:uncharacterized protein METZ01_LOCUS198053 [marine metagenome]|uniref:Uncharacterized protein n=1 Tax=marine metagenome TaxID=408172 RepID=A0A382E458_9ZZZZ